MELLGVVIVIGIALAFDFVNGFHDAANSIATVVSTRVLSPRLAVIWAAFFNFVAFLVFGTVVAATFVPKIMKATKLKNAAHTTACCGESTRVETTVAIELAASWKPLKKSNANAMAMMMTTQIVMRT